MRSTISLPDTICKALDRMARGEGVSTDQNVFDKAP